MGGGGGGGGVKSGWREVGDSERIVWKLLSDNFHLKQS